MSGIYRGAGGTGDAINDASSQATITVQARDAALAAQAAAEAAAAEAAASVEGIIGPQGPTGATGAGVVVGGTAGQVLTKINSTNYNTQWSTPATGTVTSVAATVPSFLSVSGSPVTSSGTLAIAYSGTALPVANGGSGATTLTGVLKGNGTSAFTAATAGTDFVAPATATSFTALQTFAGSSSLAALKTTNIKEVATVSATAATGTINYDATTQSVLYYTSNASGNFTVNFRGSSGTTLNTIMATGESMSFTFMNTNNATAYYNSVIQVDGTTTGVTTKWQGGTAPTSGNASAIDIYSYVIIKTGSATFTVLASQTKFA